MNKDIYYKFRILDDAMAKVLDALHDLKRAMDDAENKTTKNKAKFNNGNLVINGVEYPVENFTVEWRSRDE